MSSRKLDSLQAGRGIAALMVLLFHTETVTEIYHPHSILKWVFDAGWSGIDYFFVLSGFLMMFVHGRDIGKRMNMGSYLRKRFIRIYPIYWALCAVLIPLVFLLPSIMKNGGKLTVPILVSSLLLIPHQGARLIGVTWTLEYEVTFYVFFALLLVSKRLGTMVLSLWGAAVVGFLFLGPAAVDSLGVPLLHPFLLAFLLNLHCVEFLLGIAVAVAIRRGFYLPRPALALGLSIAAFFVFLSFDTITGLAHRDRRLAIAGYAVLATAVLLSSVLAEQRHRPTLPRWLQELGAASYSIYITHFLVITVARAVIGRVHILAAVPAGITLLFLVPAALIPGLLLHRFVERPLLAYLSLRNLVVEGTVRPEPVDIRQHSSIRVADVVRR